MKTANAIAAIERTGTEDDNFHKYEAVAASENDYFSRHASTDVEGSQLLLQQHLRQFRSRNTGRLVKTAMSAFGVFVFFYLAILGHSQSRAADGSCDSIENGFTCQPNISHSWGQYSSYFSVQSDIVDKVPDQCQVTFAQVVSRHGARDPSAQKSTKYSDLIDRIHSQATSYSTEYAFIEDYKYTLGADQLTLFGSQQMVNSGIEFYNRYRTIAKNIIPFVRASGQNRVIESAQNWTQGFHQAKLQDSNPDDDFPYNIVVISEEPGSNNTLDHGLCTEFEDDFPSTIGQSAKHIWLSIFSPNITARLNFNVPGVNFTSEETIHMMSLCPFNTVADELGTISPFCALFTEKEWHAYDYYQSLGKYYGYSWGNPLGATQGVGFTNELIARMTSSPVIDHTSTNSTLDEDPSTFPLGRDTILYADFSHDNEMTSIFASLGLYNSTAPLLNTTTQSATSNGGYSASWTVPFAARAYFEKMKCVGAGDEYVRVIVNDRVLPLDSCGGDEFGKCSLSNFIDSLSFAQQGGDWDQCFTSVSSSK